MQGYKDQLYIRQCSLDTVGGVKPVQKRHRDVGKNDIRPKGQGCFDQGPSVLHSRNDIEVSREERFECFCY
jgi:hypothetical protein